MNKILLVQNNDKLYGIYYDEYDIFYTLEIRDESDIKRYEVCGIENLHAFSKKEEINNFILDNYLNIGHIKEIVYTKHSNNFNITVSNDSNNGSRHLKLRDGIDYTICASDKINTLIIENKTNKKISRVYVYAESKINNIIADNIKMLEIECNNIIPSIKYNNIDILGLRISNIEGRLDVGAFSGINKIVLELKRCNISIYNSNIMKHCKELCINYKEEDYKSSQIIYTIDLNLIESNNVIISDLRKINKCADYVIKGHGRVDLEVDIINTLDLREFKGCISPMERVYQIKTLINKVYLGDSTLINNDKLLMKIQNLFIEKDCTNIENFIKASKTVYKNKGVKYTNNEKFIEYTNLEDVYKEHIKFYNKLSLLGLQDNLFFINILHVKDAYRLYCELQGEYENTKSNFQYLIEALQKIPFKEVSRNHIDINHINSLFMNIKGEIEDKLYNIMVFKHPRIDVCRIVIYEDNEIIADRIIQGELDLPSIIKNNSYKYIFDHISNGDLLRYKSFSKFDNLIIYDDYSKKMVSAIESLGMLRHYGKTYALDIYNNRLIQLEKLGNGIKLTLIDTDKY